MLPYHPFAPTRDVTAAIHCALWWLLAIFLLVAMAIIALLFALTFGLVHGNNEHNISLTVDLGYSQYQGMSADSGVSQWLGIRYAAPPLGDLRFRAPQDPLSTSGVQNANQHGSICLPTPSTSLSKTASEDCLFLDVYAPSANSDTPHPVFVFIQGGGFNTDSNPNLNGGPLIVAGDHDIVLVTFNYRVGPWGFLTSKEIQADGDLNVGLLDQRKVLQWVQKYIHLFNGDPNHVTLGGDSAGAASVDLQLSAYGGRDDGLIHAAVGESQSFGAQFTVEEAQYQYNGLVNRSGCSNSSDTLKCLRELPVATLAKDDINMPTPGGPGGIPVYMYSTVIDGKFSMDYSYNLYAQGKFLKVPVIFGDDTNEGTVFTPPSISSVETMNTFLRNNYVNLTDTQLSTIDTLYPPGPAYPGRSAYWTAAAKVYGEMRYICPGIYLSSQFPQFGMKDSWNYHWDVLSPSNNASGLGVVHTAELPSIWGTSSSPDSALIPTIQAYWTSFIRTKDPNTHKLPDAPRWESFDAAGMRRLHFPNDPTKVDMETVPTDQRTRCAFLSGIGPSLAQ